MARLPEAIEDRKFNTVRGFGLRDGTPSYGISRQDVAGRGSVCRFHQEAHDDAHKEYVVNDHNGADNFE